MGAQIVALCNQKGGVGKTTTCFQLARAAVRAGKRVLAIDNDPQGNLSAVAAKVPPGDTQAGLADALSVHSNDQLSDVVVAGVWPGLDLVPTSGSALGAVRDELVISGAGREQRLAQALAGFCDGYDLVLIDCAPSLDQLTINGLCAADSALVVTHSKLWSANGLAQLLDTLSAVRAYYNPSLEVAGIVVNQHEENTISGKNWLGQLQAAADQRGIEILNPPIPKRVVIADATEAAIGLDEWGSKEAAELADIYVNYFNQIVKER